MVLVSYPGLKCLFQLFLVYIICSSGPGFATAVICGESPIGSHESWNRNKQQHLKKGGSEGWDLLRALFEGSLPV